MTLLIHIFKDPSNEHDIESESNIVNNGQETDKENGTKVSELVIESL